ncbi:hypothetical protein FIBSPDRAFT_967274 [Athelia psychrophila]|uniref:Uncharacterized protein n=1 Tax=Athelia psychrophila TaxID=1759441 RepID=A0A167VVW7_9AGAM|nr:hypothetical protein FIBSPDRAFT_967274 [Fibularhizoctonia sp. CBS 109695]
MLNSNNIHTPLLTLLDAALPVNERAPSPNNYAFAYDPAFAPGYNYIDPSHSYELPYPNADMLLVSARPGLPPFPPPDPPAAAQPTAFQHPPATAARPGPPPFPPSNPPASAQPIAFQHPSVGLPPATADAVHTRIRSTTPIVIDTQPTTPILPTPPLNDSGSDRTPAHGASQPARGHKAHYSAVELEELVRITIKENPFGAKHGEKGAAWKHVAQQLKAIGHFRRSSAETLKHKLMALIAYQEDPESHAGSKVAREMSGTSGIKIAALLDRISEMQTSCRPPPKKVCRSLSTTAQAGSSTGDLDDLKDILVEDGKKRDERQQEMVETLKESTRVYERTSKKYLAAILQLSKQQ